ncbi:hypothetical protein [Hymenobacter convexus]|uniref:hypothetical protein n=1 Tax=Hymenobacter sp. CA1UV-4 TaxID=3063782 RepID=UPI0027139CA5|nr:hypothetical protein [Hymenobacter sp. CA1UV-4]MDO7851899.1 hypothetical protein [Hymenobacter sp. CA1UV-4]
MKSLFTFLIMLFCLGSARAQTISYTVPKAYKTSISKDDYKQIVDLSVAAIAKEYPVKQVKDGAVELQGRSQGTLNLDNLIAKCLAAPDKSQWNNVIQDHFTNLFASVHKQAHLNVQNFDTAAKYFSLRIYSQQTVAQRGGIDNFVAKTDLEGTYTMLMLDLPGAFTPISKALFNSWNKSAAEVFQIAQRNVNKQPIQKITKSFDVTGGSIEMSFLGNEDYAGSYALDLANNSPELVGKWGAVVAIPNKGLVNICRISPEKPVDFVQFIQRTKALVEKSYAEHPQPISNRFFWYYQNHFTPITVTTGPKGEAMVVAPLGLSTLLTTKN